MKTERPGKDEGVHAAPFNNLAIMRFRPVFFALISLFYAAVLGGCGGSPNPPALQSPAASRNLPQGSSGDLLYVNSTTGNGFIFSYPSGQFITEFTIASGVTAWGACADSSGDVFITVEVNSTTSSIYEYAHGATTPSAILNDNGYVATACASDPTTGNLAVVSADESASGKDNVAIYAHATGEPTRYYDSKVTFQFCDYDDSGNLFADGSGKHQLAELPSGGKSFKNIPLDKELIMPGGIVWDGSDLAIEYASFSPKYSGIDRVELAGGKGKIVDSIDLKDLANRTASFALEDGTLIEAGGQTLNEVGLWNYPAGGKIVKLFRAKGASGQTFYGLALSVSPAH